MIKLLPVVKALVVFLMLVSGVAMAEDRQALPYYDDATFTPQWLEDGSDAVGEIHRIPNFSLTNQLGETITRESVDKKVYVVNFFFASCSGICPSMQSRVTKLQEEFKDREDFLLVSHSVTPQRDDVPTLKAYAEKNGMISGKWHLLTGEKRALYALAIDHYFANEDLGVPSGEVDFLHSSNVMLLDRNQRIRGIYNGLNDASMQTLIEDAKILLGP